jgi:thioredoxin-related protein
MRLVILNLLIILSMSFLACNSGQTKDPIQSDSTKTATNENLKLQVYYFHSTNRCPTCQSIEDNVKKVIENDFKDLVAKGEINFKVLCVDDSANKALAEKYEAAGAALHFVKYENGKERDNDLTEFAFMHSHNEPDFFQKGIQDTIRYFLK